MFPFHFTQMSGFFPHGFIKFGAQIHQALGNSGMTLINVICLFMQQQGLSPGTNEKDGCFSSG